MKIHKLFFIIPLFLLSCVTMKWKQEYAAKNVINFQKQYGENDKLTGGAIPPEIFTSTRLATKKEFKKKFNYIEHSLAIVPDSIQYNSGKVDSIYTNKYKIYYLKKNRLKTGSMIFLDK